MTYNEPCSALRRDGTPCGRTVGTSMTVEGVRCNTHIKRDRRQRDPSARPPVRHLRDMNDLKRLSNWSIMRLADGSLSAPVAQAIAKHSATWLRAFEGRFEEAATALQAQSAALLDMGSAWSVPPAQQARFNAALERLRHAMDVLTALQPTTRETAQEATQRARRQRERDEGTYAAWRSASDALDDDAGDAALERDDAS